MIRDNGGIDSIPVEFSAGKMTNSFWNKIEFNLIMGN